MIPSSVTNIDSAAFGNGEILKSLSIDKTLYDKSGSSAFSDCYKLYDSGITYLQDNDAKITGKTAKVKKKKVKKKAQTIAASKVYNVSPKTGVIAEKVSGNAKITVNKANGNITVAKKTKKGTYKIKVKVKSTGNAQYKASDWKEVTITVKVK